MLAMMLTGMFGFASAQGSEDPDYFRLGIDAFKNKQYAQAIELMRLARESGVDDEILAFNLGSALYRLQDYPSALDEFSRISTNSPLFPRVEFNLALIAVKRDKLDEAREIFVRLESQNLPTLSAMAREMIMRIDGEQSQSVGTHYLYVSVSGGIEDKTLEPETGTPGEETNVFSNILLLGSTSILPSLIRHASAEVTMFGLVNMRHQEYDIDMLNVDLEKSFRFSNVSLKIAPGVGAMGMGYKPYSGDLHIGTEAKISIADILDIKPRYSFSRIQHMSDNSAVSGTQQKVGIQTQSDLEEIRLQADVVLESNNRNDTSDTTYRIYSPKRITAQVDIQLFRERRASPKFMLEWRISDYPAVSHENQRRDQRIRFRNVSNIKINQWLTAVADVSYTENSSSPKTSFSYNRWEFVLGLEGMYY